MASLRIKGDAYALRQLVLVLHIDKNKLHLILQWVSERMSRQSADSASVRVGFDWLGASRELDIKTRLGH